MPNVPHYSRESLDHLAGRVRAVSPGRGPMLIGIDGRGGAGKSTLAAELAERLDDAVVVHMDDLYLSVALRHSKPTGVGMNYDRARLVEQVLRPLREHGAARYQRYDWDADAVADWIEIADADVVIVEGVTAIADDIAEYFDVTIWVETPPDTCLERGVERDGEAMRAQWEQVWLPGDDEYRQVQRPDARADVVISGDRG